jgi:hypothetical protein
LFSYSRAQSQTLRGYLLQLPSARDASYHRSSATSCPHNRSASNLDLQGIIQNHLATPALFLILFSGNLLPSRVHKERPLLAKTIPLRSNAVPVLVVSGTTWAFNLLEAAQLLRNLDAKRSCVLDNGVGTFDTMQLVSIGLLRLTTSCAYLQDPSRRPQAGSSTCQIDCFTSRGHCTSSTGSSINSSNDNLFGSLSCVPNLITASN